MNKKYMEEFTEKFGRILYPTIKGKDGRGIERLKELVEEKKKKIAERKSKK